MSINDPSFYSKVISIKEARKLMGDACALMSDDQVIELVDMLNLLSKQVISELGSKND